MFPVNIQPFPVNPQSFPRAPSFNNDGLVVGLLMLSVQARAGDSSSRHAIVVVVVVVVVERGVA